MPLLTLWTQAMFIAIMAHAWNPPALPEPWHSITMPRVCFVPEGGLPEGEHEVECRWGTLGKPARTAVMRPESPSCCFWGTPQPGMFWAYGEATVSRVEHAFDPQEDEKAAQELGILRIFRTITVPFALQPAESLDVQVVAGNSVISGARVTLADESVHLAAQERRTDGDGYAVFAVIPHVYYALRVRADGFLPIEARVRMVPGKEEEVTVELDVGIALTGTVTDPDGRPLPGATLHVEITGTEYDVWNSDAAGQSPSTDRRGQFVLDPLPRGKMRVYATHPNYVPSKALSIDASDEEEFAPQTLAVRTPRRALIRTQTADGTAVPASLTAIDEATGIELASVRMPARGALEASFLSETVRFVADADGFQPFSTVRDVADNDEIVLELSKTPQDYVVLTVRNEADIAVPDATATLTDAALRRRHPACTGRSDAVGRIEIPTCPAHPCFEIHHRDYAPRIACADENPSAVWVLQSGVPVQIALADGRQTPVAAASCSLSTTFPGGTVIRESFAARDGRLALAHRPDVRHEIRCDAPDGRTASTAFSPSDSPIALEFPVIAVRECIVLDALGAPVPYARIETGHASIETDENGRAEITAQPGQTLDVYQWHHGHAAVPFAEGTGELELRLPDAVDPRTLECLKKHGIAHIVDGAAVYLDASDDKRGYARGDIVESCAGNGMVVVRDVFRRRVGL